jgi:protein-S-isoprenylcysteine O-methyltransferase Ste14
MKILPPALYLLLALASTAVGLLVPVAGPVGGAGGWVLRLAGLILLVGGLAVTVLGSRRFATVGTNINTFRDPDLLVTDGLFGLTRNPMYLGFLVSLVGVAGAVGSLSALFGPLLFAGAAQWWYIPFEEQRMEAQFGPAYDHYRRHVGRWITLGRP